MAKSNWIISGSGGQAVIDVDGSKRCQLSGTKQMLWNGRDDLINSEVIVTLKPDISQNGYQKGGVLLRCDSSILNYYRISAVCYPNYRTYYIYRVINGVSTVLTTVISYQAYNIYVKTRIRIDDWQISIEEYIGGSWNLITTVEDTDHSLTSGYAGLQGHSYNSSYSMLFDDVEILERV